MNRQFVMRIRTITVLAIATLVGIGLYACNETSEPPAVTDKIVVTSPQFALTGLVLLANDQGLFAKQGLEVIVDFKASGKQSLDAMLDRQSDIALAAETPGYDQDGCPSISS